MDKLLEHRVLICLGVMAVSILSVCSLTINGAMWTKGDDKDYLKASLLQIKRCGPAGVGPEQSGDGVLCSGVENSVMEVSGWFSAFRWTLLASLFVIVLGVAAWGSNRLAPERQFPDPSVGAVVLLFAEILGVAVVLMAFKPDGWSHGSGYYLFLLACGATIAAGLFCGADLTQE